MPRDQVQVRGRIAHPPQAVWAVLRDFCGAWHPGVASIRAERDPRGALIRAFTVQGETTLYREQLTWVSDSDRTLGYTHLEGIRDCEAHDARISVSPSEAGGSTVVWTATIRAPVSRLEDICTGTRAIFEAGLKALSGAARNPPSAPERAPVSPAAAPPARSKR